MDSFFPDNNGEGSGDVVVVVPNNPPSVLTGVMEVDVVIAAVSTVTAAACCCLLAFNASRRIRNSSNFDMALEPDPVDGCVSDMTGTVVPDDEEIIDASRIDCDDNVHLIVRIT